MTVVAVINNSISAKIRLLIADDHALVRMGLQALLATESDLEIVGEAINGDQAIRLAEQLRPDVVLIDLVMPMTDGIEAIKRILQDRPETWVLVLTSFSSDDKVFPAIKAGASGYLLKNSRPDELIEGIRQVAHGEVMLHPSIARRVLQELSGSSTQPLTTNPLTGRELDVLRLIARGLSNDDIARTLVIGEVTVRTHVSSILGKLQLANRTQAALYALREGLASLDDPDPIDR